jgi:hypothetical protein
MKVPIFPFDPSLLETQPLQVVVERIYDLKVGDRESGYESRERMASPFPAKSLLEVPGLLEQALRSQQEREQIDDKSRLIFTLEDPDVTRKLETITFSVVKSAPGGLGNGSPFGQQAMNLRPFLREERDDPDNPGYKKAVLGQWFDNIIRLTCWAHDSWGSEKRVNWLMDTIEEYTWWLTMQGISRIWFWGRNADETREVQNNKIYGKSVDYFVRTEKLSTVSTKVLEELVIKLSVQGG